VVGDRLRGEALVELRALVALDRAPIDGIEGASAKEGDKVAGENNAVVLDPGALAPTEMLDVAQIALAGDLYVETLADATSGARL
jgi:hypothetical protein